MNIKKRIIVACLAVTLAVSALGVGTAAAQSYKGGTWNYGTSWWYNCWSQYNHPTKYHYAGTKRDNSNWRICYSVARYDAYSNSDGLFCNKYVKAGY